MRKLFTLLATALLALPMAGKTIDANQAAQTAARFMSGHSALRSTQDLELVYTGQSESQLRAGEAPSFYVYNVKNGTGFVIVAGDDVSRPILGYSFKSSFSADMPDHVEAFLDRYDEQIRWAKENGVLREALDILPNPDEGKLLETALWNQRKPYNWEMPILTNAKGEEEQAVTGCVATAAAIIMQYHQYPTKFQGGVHTWISSKGATVTLPDSTTVSNERELTVNMDEPTFDWSKMLHAYKSDQYSEAEGQEVAKLMKYIGAGVNMGYNLAAYGGSGSTDHNLHKALINYFQYPGARKISRPQLTDAAFQRILHEEIDANRPMIYTSVSGGHAFVCDGYGPEDYYHFNMGWGGLNNGYYPIDAIHIEHKGGAGASTTTDNYSGGVTLLYNLIPSAKETTTDLFTYYSIGLEEGDEEEEAKKPMGIFQTDSSATIEQGKPFGIDLLCVTPINLFGAKNVQIAVAHLAADGTLKELVCTPQTREFPIDLNSLIEFFAVVGEYPIEQWEEVIASHPELINFFQIIDLIKDTHFEALACQINQPIEAGDYLMAVSSQDGGKQWLPIVSQVDLQTDKKLNADVIELTASTANASIEAAAQANIYVAEGKLCIDNAEGEVQVYTATGACVATQTVKGSARMALPKGIYFVKIGQTTTKVICKPF